MRFGEKIGEGEFDGVKTDVELLSQAAYTL